MTTNSRECKIIEIEVGSFEVDIEVALPLCPIDCDAPDVPTIKLPITVFDQGSSSMQISVVGYNKLHIIASDGRAECIVVSLKRIIKCQNCSEGCDPIVIEEDVGCVGSGHILATGDYIIYIKPQVNWTGEALDGLSVKIILEPLILEHINVALLNNAK